MALRGVNDHRKQVRPPQTHLSNLLARLVPDLLQVEDGAECLKNDTFTKSVTRTKFIIIIMKTFHLETVPTLSRMKAKLLHEEHFWSGTKEKQKATGIRPKQSIGQMNVTVLLSYYSIE